MLCKLCSSCTSEKVSQRKFWSCVRWIWNVIINFLYQVVLCSQAWSYHLTMSLKHRCKQICKVWVSLLGTHENHRATTPRQPCFTCLAGTSYCKLPCHHFYIILTYAHRESQNSPNHIHWFKCLCRYKPNLPPHNTRLSAVGFCLINIGMYSFYIKGTFFSLLGIRWHPDIKINRYLPYSKEYKDKYRNRMLFQ